MTTETKTETTTEDTITLNSRLRTEAREAEARKWMLFVLRAEARRVAARDAAHALVEAATAPMEKSLATFFGAGDGTRENPCPWSVDEEKVTLSTEAMIRFLVLAGATGAASNLKAYLDAVRALEHALQGG